MSDIEEFLAENVEKHLIRDLEVMVSDKQDLGFPVLMATIAGMELLGGLDAAGNEFAIHGKGDEYFRRYWNKYLYPAEHQHHSPALASQVFDSVRNGIAHGFYVLEGVEIHTSRDDRHLTTAEDGIFHIDAVSLAEAFVASYRERFRDVAIGSDQHASAIRKRYRSLRTQLGIQPSKRQNASSDAAASGDSQTVGLGAAAFDDSAVEHRPGSSSRFP
ncbi:MAG: hypothetical protein H3C62_01795 [Gemmatimonadaceae bacterium]|nr:hypothetical protein [Gemmatimonadaceae bacterium]